MCIFPCYPRVKNFASTCYRICCNCFLGYGFLLVLLAYQLLNFVCVVSVSIGLTAFITICCDLCFGEPGMRPDAQTIITLLFIATYGECSLIIIQDCLVGNWFKDKAEKYPFIVGRMPMILYAWIFLLSCSQLFIQYKIAHPADFFYPDGYKSNAERQKINSLKLDQTVTFFYLLSLTYIAYVTSRFSDWVRYRCRLSRIDRLGRISSCGAYVFYLWVQILLLYMYGVPVFVAAALCKFSAMSAHTTFMVINFGAVVIGYNVVQIESSKPFPTVSMLPPDFRYESHLCSRVNVLQYILFPLVAFCYYGSGKAFQAMKPEDRFIIYTICVGLTTLQATKVIFDVRFMDAIRKLRLRRQQIDLAIHADPVDVNRLHPGNPPTNPQPSAHTPSPDEDDSSNSNQSSNNNPVPGPSGLGVSATDDESNNTSKKPDNTSTKPESPDVNQNQPNNDGSSEIITQGNQDLDLALKPVDRSTTSAPSYSKNPENKSFVVELDE